VADLSDWKIVLSLLTFIVAVIVLFLLTVGGPSIDWDALHRWQTLTAGLCAVAAATIAVVGAFVAANVQASGAIRAAHVNRKASHLQMKLQRAEEARRVAVALLAELEHAASAVQTGIDDLPALRVLIEKLGEVPEMDKRQPIRIGMQHILARPMFNTYIDKIGALRSDTANAVIGAYIQLSEAFRDSGTPVGELFLDEVSNEISWQEKRLNKVQPQIQAATRLLQRDINAAGDRDE
jgi:hypothetical protein